MQYNNRHPCPTNSATAIRSKVSPPAAQSAKVVEIRVMAGEELGYRYKGKDVFVLVIDHVGIQVKVSEAEQMSEPCYGDQSHLEPAGGVPCPP